MVAGWGGVGWAGAVVERVAPGWAAERQGVRGEPGWEGCSA